MQINLESQNASGLNMPIICLCTEREDKGIDMAQSTVHVLFYSSVYKSLLPSNEAGKKEEEGGLAI